MHEMGIAQQMVNIALSSIPDDMADARVEKMHLRIGKLAAVVEHSLRFCFEIITRDTPLENTELVIEEVPVTAQCKGCGHKWEVEGPVFRCPACETGEVEMLTGRELEIQSLEVEEN
ncbi:MAG: hydrogenase maturation nickel metallochaperone HypA [Desulfobacteraceae bacterium]